MNSYTFRRWCFFLSVVSPLFAVPAMATHTCTQDGFFPPNKLKIGVNQILDANMSEATFNKVIGKIDAYYRPIMAQKGGNLVIDKNWQDGTVNAYADRQGNNWIIKMYGGLARHPIITEDGFTLVVCHETGHHLGGAPKFPGQWAADEGEADYFANLKCLRNVWAGENNVEIVKTLGVPSAVAKNCEMSFGDANAIAICERASMAGLSSAKLMQALSGEGPVDFSTPDSHIVPATYDQHPAAQCRLDTYYAGSICQVAASEPLSDTDPHVGACATETGSTRGYRPLCWYKPNGPGPHPTPTPTPTPTVSPTPWPTPTPTNSAGVARPPVGANGQTTVIATNPNLRVDFGYDTTEFPGAAGIWFEVSAPNRPFSEPNGITPDPARTIGATLRGARGGFFMIPARVLPGWGNYQIRVIPLDSTGRRAVGRFSNPATFILRPN
jgi:hypothetical protein